MAIKEANAQVVMSAYNKLNNIYCSSDENLLINILKMNGVLMVVLSVIGALQLKLFKMH